MRNKSVCIRTWRGVQRRVVHNKHNIITSVGHAVLKNIYFTLYKTIQFEMESDKAPSAPGLGLGDRGRSFGGGNAASGACGRP